MTHQVDVTPLPAASIPTRTAAVALISFQRTVLIPSAPEALGTALGLSTAEANIALCIARGEPVSAIAWKRGVTPTTVRNQLRSIYGKTGAASRVELVRRVFQALGGTLSC